MRILGTPDWNGPCEGIFMNEKHQASLVQYVNDMIGVERDICNALRLQVEDDRVMAYPDLAPLLAEAARAGERRLEKLKSLSHDEGGSMGAALKEGITAVTGTLAGIYGKVREHPVSRMVRDDIIAFDVASVGYGMLLTLGLSLGHEETVDIAAAGLSETPPWVIRLTDLLPLIVSGELADDAPLSNPAAVQIACTRIRDAWNVSGG